MENQQPQSAGALPPAARRQPQPYSKSDRLLAKVMGFLEQQFAHCVLPDDIHVLVDRSLGIAYRLETSCVLGRIKEVAHRKEGLNISKGVIDSAVEIMRCRPVSDVTVSTERCIRSPNGELWICDQQGWLVFHWGQQGYQRPQSWPNVAMLPSLRAKQPPFTSASGSGFSIEPLRQALQRKQVAEGDDLLVTAWMVTALLPGTSNLLLELTGERHSGKSALQAWLKAMLDHHQQPLVKEVPTSRKAVQQLAQEHQLISLDSVEAIKPAVQRELFNVLTGTHIPWRAQGQQHEAFANVERSVVMNGLQSRISDPELVERSLTIDLLSSANIPDQMVGSMTHQMDGDGAFTSLMMLLGKCSWYATVQLQRDVPSPLVDFCKIGCLIADSLSISRVTFWKSFDESQRQRREWQLEENPVAWALRGFMSDQEEDEIEKRVGDWLEILSEYRPDASSSAQWPASSREMGYQLSASVDLMRAHGLHVTRGPKRGGYCYYKVTRGHQDAPATVEDATPKQPNTITDTLGIETPELLF